jgi:hypothetical protein
LRRDIVHFRAELTVLLNEPILCEDSPDGGEVIGYMIVIGVNAPDLAIGVRYAHDLALRPMKPDGTFQTFDGVVVEAEVKRIEKEDWEPFIRENAKRIDQQGVYYSTGLIFFGAEESN